MDVGGKNDGEQEPNNEIRDLGDHPECVDRKKERSVHQKTKIKKILLGGIVPFFVIH